MASNRFVVFAVAAIFLPLAATAVEYKVGDDAGWIPTVDYAKWASDKVFYEGDVLVFSYDPAKHNVIKTDANGFKACNTTGNKWSSGNDNIRLTAGRKWYICGFHCASANQKLVIDVSPSAPSPAPTTDAALGLACSWYQVLVAVGAVAALVIMV